MTLGLALSLGLILAGRVRGLVALVGLCALRVGLAVLAGLTGRRAGLSGLMAGGRRRLLRSLVRLVPLRELMVLCGVLAVRIGHPFLTVVGRHRAILLSGPPWSLVLSIGRRVRLPLIASRTLPRPGRRVLGTSRLTIGPRLRDLLGLRPLRLPVGRRRSIPRLFVRRRLRP